MELYRRQFRPSAQLDRPYVMAGVNAIAADTDQLQAQQSFHVAFLQQAFVNLRRGMPGQIPPPIDDIDAYCSPVEKAMIDPGRFRARLSGSAEAVSRGLRDFIDRTQVDELMITANIYEHAARLESFRIIAEIHDRLEYRLQEE